MSFTEHPADFDADGPDVITPLTGTGALPAAARGVRFAAAAGYRLEQVERFSSLDLAAALRPCWTAWSGKRWPGRRTTSC